MKRLKISSVSIWGMVIGILVGMLFLAISYFGNEEFQAFEDATEKCILCEKAAKDLQDGSDYLTEQVRLYAMTGQKKYMDAYFTEADSTCRREKALEQLRNDFAGTDAFAALQSALDYSQKLMATEYYSMRLVSEAKNFEFSEWPIEVQTVTLSANDQALSADEKIDLAQKMVCDNTYQNMCSEIDNKITECMNSLIQQTQAQQLRSSAIFSDMYRTQEIGILILMFIMLAMCIMVRKLIVVPLLKYNENIRRGETFDVDGAEELQILAETYNQVYMENQEAQLLTQHKAEHDSLTDLLNRGSFDKILKIYEANGSSFALIIIDVDSFKSINDTYGHAEGDTILKSVAALLVNAFRSVDHVFRIGGDEFAVIMIDMNSGLQYTIRNKIDAINSALASEATRLQHVSLSAGAAFSDRPKPNGNIFEAADQALYQRKSNGKSGCSFY